MFGKNPPLGPVKTTGETLLVREQFLTIQGEGPLAGHPAFFIRLAGCPLRCAFCDTEFSEENSVEIPAEYLAQLADEALKYPKLHRWVVLTGGEPFRHPIGPLLKALNNRSVSVQVETSGVMPPPDGSIRMFSGYNPTAPVSEMIVNRIVISPKVGKIDTLVAARAFAWKYVLEAGKIDERDGLPAFCNQAGARANQTANRPGRPFGTPAPFRTELEAPIFVQACDVLDEDKNALNLQAAADSALKFGYRLGVQIHKLAGLR